MGCREGSRTWRQNAEAWGTTGLMDQQQGTNVHAGVYSAQGTHSGLPAGLESLHPGLGQQIRPKNPTGRWMPLLLPSRPQINTHTHTVHTQVNPKGRPGWTGPAVAAVAPVTGAPHLQASPLGTNLAGGPRGSLNLWPRMLCAPASTPVPETPKASLEVTSAC